MPDAIDGASTIDNEEKDCGDEYGKLDGETKYSPRCPARPHRACGETARDAGDCAEHQENQEHYGSPPRVLTEGTPCVGEHVEIEQNNEPNRNP